MTSHSGTKLEQEMARLYEEHNLDPTNIPMHIAIVMDGNGRWATMHNKSVSYGHKQGSEALRTIIQACDKFGIKHLTVYAFSTENWVRPKKEVSFLMKLFEELMSRETKRMHQKNIVVTVRGKINELSQNLQNKIKEAHKLTHGNTGLHLNLMINYGSRLEIVDACKAIAKKIELKLITSDDISEDLIQQHLTTAEVPDPDIFLRTSGEYRLSNFLLWQAAYSELIISDILWPDFGEASLIDVLKTYQKRDRRFGGRK